MRRPLTPAEQTASDRIAERHDPIRRARAEALRRVQVASIIIAAVVFVILFAMGPAPNPQNPAQIHKETVR